MTPEAQRIAIAEVCGWENIDMYINRSPLPFTKSYLGGTCDGQGQAYDLLGRHIEPLPDYLADLNAMHEAERVCFKEGTAWMRFIDAVVVIYWGKRDDTHGNPYTGLEECCACLRATAAQRAEAFLRTLNLWKD